MTSRCQTLVDQMNLDRQLIGQGVKVGVLVISEEEDNVCSQFPGSAACERGLYVT